MAEIADTGVQKGAGYAGEDVKFTDVLGDSINNLQFSQGWLHAAENPATQDAYVWTALSACGDVLADTVYQNVRNYVDLAANVETCKVKALLSMLREMGLDFMFGQTFSDVPLKLMNMLDAYSVDRKYLFASGVLSPTTVMHVLSAAGAKYAGPDYVSPAWTSAATWENLSASLSTAGIDETTWCISAIGLDREELQGLSGEIPKYWTDGGGWSVLSGCLTAYSVDETKWNEAYGGISAYMDPGDIGDGTPRQIYPISVWTQLSGRLSGQYTLDDDSYKAFLSVEYAAAISSILVRRYNASEKALSIIGIDSPPYIYIDAVKTQYGERNPSIDNPERGSIRDFMIQNGVPLSFDYQAIADGIDAGTDSLDNYDGTRLCVILMEQEERAAQKEWVSAGEQQVSGMLGRMSRYAWYAEREVIDCAKFIDNRYYASELSGGFDRYRVDPSYWVLSGDDIPHVLPSNPSKISCDPENDIRWDMVETVAGEMATVTMRLRDLRERLKLQTRKNYMKGTNNLFVLAINEYLRDYGKYANVPSALADIKDNLSKINISDIDVSEYFDHTEYFNICCDTSISARGGLRDVSERFWQDGAMDRDGRDFTRQQIDRFYLSSMLVKNGLTGELGHEDLTSFLDVIFDYGAKRQFMGTDGYFATQLSGGEFTNTVVDRLIRLSSDYLWLAGYAPSYSFKTASLSAQAQELALSAVKTAASASFYVDVSSSYQKWWQNAVDISAESDACLGSYEEALSAEDSLYFVRFGTGDYYIDNLEYAADNVADMTSKLEQFISRTDNMVNHQLTAALATVKSDFARLSADYDEDVMSTASKYGYADTLRTASVDDKIKDVGEYLESRKQSREEALAQIAQNIKDQSDNLKASYDAVNQSFKAAVAGYDSGSSNCVLTAGTYCYFGAGDPPNAEGEMQYLGLFNARTVISAHMEVSKDYYTEPGTGFIMYSKKKGKYAGYSVTLPSSKVYKETASLAARCTQLEYWMGRLTFMDNTYGLKKDGTVMAAAQTRTELGRLDKQCGVILDLLAEVGINFHSDVANLNTRAEFEQKTIEDRIDQLAKYINGSLRDKLIETDPTLKALGLAIQKSASYQADWEQSKKDFQAIAQSERQSSYVQGYIAAGNSFGDLTWQSMLNLSSYIADADAGAKSRTMDRIRSLQSQQERFRTEYKALAAQMHTDYGYSPVDSYYIESAAKSAVDAVLKTVQNNLDAAAQNLDLWMKDETWPRVTFVSSEIAGAGFDGDFMQQAKKRLAQLNFFRNPKYTADRAMFDSYTGLSSSDYPYFNYKNVTHPSYQVHPYVWNFVEKNKETVNSLLTVFYSAAVDDLEMHRISLCCDAYYGEYGQPIDRWRFPDTLDYTGYTTEYESGDHIQQDTGIYSEVVDYTGMFYPPAVEYLSANVGYFDRCVMSIRDAETKKSTKTFIVKQLSGNIIDHIDVKTEKTAGILAYSFVSPEKTFSRISAAMRYYAVDDQTVKDAISGYFSALDSASWTASGCADAVVSAIPETFYGMFYRHLSWNREQYEIQRDWVADQLEEYWSGDGSVTRISDIMKPAPLSDQYDIWQYGSDNDGNQYGLYKKYSKNGPTWLERRDTAGEMWIRLTGHPIAFPAFAGKHPQVYMDTANNAVRILAGLESGSAISAADNPMRWFYDFRFSDDRTQMALVSKQVQVDGYVPAENFQTYENPWIAMLPASSKRIGNTLRVDMSNDLSALDFIRSGQDPYSYSALVDGMTGDTQAWAYVGSFNSKTDDINHVYALKTYDPAALSAKLECMIRVYPTRDCRLLDGDRMLEYDGRPIDDGNLSSLGSIRMIDGGEELYSDQIRCCGSVSGGQRTLTLAYLVKQREGTLRNKAFPEQSVDVPAAQDGPAYEDGTTDEMNSYDGFECDVRMLNLRVTDSQMRPVSSPENFNLNADPSYIPLYPGREGALSSVSLSVADEYNIELLGPATPGMEEALARVNTDVDPYFDADTVKDSRLFGMVYEEFDEKAYDRSFRIYENPSINARSVLPERDGIYDMYVWRQSLAQYSENDLLRLRIALANTAALGKSPYLFAPLSAVPSVPVDVNYDPPTDSAETEINVGAGGRILASGTYDQISRSVQTCTNRLDGVRAVKVWIADGSFNIGFVRELGVSDDVFQVPGGQVQLAIFNEYDITVFEDYHYLDAYGFVKVANSRYVNALNAGAALQDQPDDGRGWGIYYDRNAVNRERGDGERVYYMNGQTNLAEFMEDIQLSDYSALSDVYAMQTRGRLSFKYQERDYFGFQSELYYYPTLNVKYPKTLGQVLAEDHQYDGAAQFDIVKRTFSEGRTFRFMLEDPAAILSGIGTVDIQDDAADAGGLLVAEDYAEAAAPYDADDAAVAPYAMWTEGDPELSVKVEEAASAVPVRMSDILDRTSTSDPESFAFAVEDEADAFQFGTTSFDGSMSGVDLTEALTVYATYSKTPKGIRLYFNYFNYINTPFVETRNGKVYPHVRPATYLKLDPGEDGTLNIDYQFRHLFGGRITGARAGTLVSYRIYNVSDDKPKFVVKRLKTVQNGDFMQDRQPSKVRVSAGSARFELADILQKTAEAKRIYLSMKASRPITVPYSVYLDYDPELFAVTPVRKAAPEYTTEFVDGRIAVRFLSKSGARVPLEIRPKGDDEVEMAQWIQSAGLDVVLTVEADNAYSERFGMESEPEIEDGVISILRSSPNLLVVEPISAAVESDLSAYVVSFTGRDERNNARYLNPIG